MKTESIEPRKQSKKYSGFVSYSQIDKKWARRLHRALESYRLPKEVASAHGFDRKLGRFFRDDDELAGSSSLRDVIETALACSKALIVICSPNAARSRWVDAEITQFKKLNPGKPILGVIVGGNPNSAGESSCFPPSLVSGNLDDYTAGPLAPDVRVEPFRRLVIRIVAGLLDLDFDTLWQREFRRIKQRRFILACSIAAVVMSAVFGWSVYLNLQQAKSDAETRDYAARAQQLIEKGAFIEAAKLALKALPEKHLTSGRTILPEAEAVVRRLAALAPAPVVFGDFKRQINMVRKSGSRELAVSLEDGSVVVFDLATGTLHHSLDSDAWLYLLPTGQAAYSTAFGTAKRSDGSVYETMTTSLHPLNNQLVMRGFTGEPAEWFVGPTSPVSMDGSRILAKNTASLRKEAHLRLAILALPAAEEGILPPVPEPEVVIDAAFAGFGEGFKASFVEENGLAFTWGGRMGERGIWRGLGLWQPGIETLALVDPLAPSTCGVARIEERVDDLVAVSEDRAYISHSMLLADESWCVQTFQASDGKLTARHKVKGAGSISGDGIDAIRPLDRNKLLLAGSIGAPLLWNSENPENIVLRKCYIPNLQDFLSLEAISNIVAVKDTLACKGEGGLYRYSKADGSYEHLPLVGTTATALSPTEAPGEVAFGTSDGKVGLWPESDFVDVETGPEFFRMTGWNGQVAYLASIPASNPAVYSAKLFTAEGRQVGTAGEFVVETPTIDLSKLGKLVVGLEPISADHLLWMEAWNCGLFKPCPQGTPRQLAVFDSRTGETILKINDLLPGEYPTPVKVAFDKERRLIAAAKWDGGLELVNLANGGGQYSIPLDGLAVSDLKFSGDSLWVIASLRGSEPSERESVLFRVDRQGEVTRITDYQAQNGWLRNIHPGKRLLIGFDRRGVEDNLPLFHVAEANDVSPPFTLGENSHYWGGSQPVAAEYKDGRIVLISSETQLLLFRAPDEALGRNLELTDLELIPVPTPWARDPLARFSVDPLGRFLFAYSDDKLFQFPLADGISGCQPLPDTADSLPTFSSDGQFMFFNNWRGSIIYQFSGCLPTLVPPNGTRGLLFSNERHIWAWGQSDKITVIEISMDLAVMRASVEEFVASSR